MLGTYRMTALPGDTRPVFADVGAVDAPNGTLDSVLAAGYPQSAPVSCTAPSEPTTGDATTQIGGGSTEPGDHYQ